MPEFDRHSPHASFAANCFLCTCPRPVHKDGLCTTHYAEFGPSWKEVGAPKKKGRGFSLTPLHKDGPRKPRKDKDAAPSE